MEQDVFVTDNLEVHKKDNFVRISVNPTLYPLEVIYSAAYIFINRAYVMIDGNPKEEVFVQLRPKDNVDLESLGREFNNELLNYMTYLYRSIRSQNIREAMVQSALGANAQTSITESRTTEASYLDDPENIAKPWKPKE